MAFVLSDYGKIYEGRSVGVTVSSARTILPAQEQSSPPIPSLGLEQYLQNVVMRNKLGNAHQRAKLY